VEHFFISKGWLIGSFHMSYWLGLTGQGLGWPQFKYINNDPFDSTSYKHWGIERNGATVSVNPNTAGAQCATSDFNLTYGGAWGWNDVDCGLVTTTVLCKIPREWLLLLLVYSAQTSGQIALVFDARSSGLHVVHAYFNGMLTVCWHLPQLSSRWDPYWLCWVRISMHVAPRAAPVSTGIPMCSAMSVLRRQSEAQLLCKLPSEQPS
jgi:hypothetical protein